MHRQGTRCSLVNLKEVRAVFADCSQFGEKSRREAAYGEREMTTWAQMAGSDGIWPEDHAQTSTIIGHGGFHGISLVPPLRGLHDQPAESRASAAPGAHRRIAERSASAACDGLVIPPQREVGTVKGRASKAARRGDLCRWPSPRRGDPASSALPAETLASVMLQLPPREACAAACACRGWRHAVSVSGRLRRVLHLGPHDCEWSAPVLSKLFARFSYLEELHLSTEVLVSLDAVKAIAACLSGSLRCFSGFVVSNVVQGRQPAVSELAKITSLESLTLEGTLLTGYSLMELGHGCPALRRLHCPEILSSHADLTTLLDRCPLLEYLSAVNLSVHNEVSHLCISDDLHPRVQRPAIATLHVHRVAIR